MFGPHGVRLGAYSWPCAQGSLLAGSEDHMRFPGLSAGWPQAKHMPNAPPPVLSLQLLGFSSGESFHVLVCCDSVLVQARHILGLEQQHSKVSPKEGCHRGSWKKVLGRWEGARNLSARSEAGQGPLQADGGSLNENRRAG